MRPPPGFPALGSAPPADASIAVESAPLWIMAFVAGGVAGFVACKVFFSGDDGGWKDRYEDAENRASVWEADARRIESRFEGAIAARDKRQKALEDDRARWRSTAQSYQERR